MCAACGLRCPISPCPEQRHLQAARRRPAGTLQPLRRSARASPERAQPIPGLDNDVVSPKYKATIQLQATGVKKLSGLKAEWR